MSDRPEIRPDHAMSHHDAGLQTLAEHWQVPVRKVARLVGKDSAAPGSKMQLSPQQARFLNCLKEIDLTLLAAHGSSRDWLKRKSNVRELAGKAPLDFIRPLDVGSAWTVLRLAGRGCAGLWHRSSKRADGAFAR